MAATKDNASENAVDLDAIRAKFKAVKTTAPTNLNNPDPVDKMVARIQSVIETVRTVDFDKLQTKETKTTWYKPRVGGVIKFKVGARPLKIEGNEWFTAKSKEELIEFYENAIVLIKYDPALADQVRDNAKKSARGPRKPK
ncbi:hypothetical protein [Rhizobium sp. P007]|uniref:hypothetical protein n=1 Tax=Rhizobium sp. P007 TaxID=285908 RepID=UPI0011580FA5|nr:hypothetical protein [Rhizobium sp. P007]CAD7041394.1 hypothetical protein RP007_00744 [Rhizobium sp. P007]